MTMLVYVATGQSINGLIDSFKKAPLFTTTQSADEYGLSLIDVDFYRSPRKNLLGEQFNIAMLMQAGATEMITPHYEFRVYASDSDSSAIAKFQTDKVIHDMYPFRIFDITPFDTGNPEDQVLAVIFRKGEFEFFPADADTAQSAWNVAPQAAFPAMTFAAEVTGAAAPNDGGSIAVDGFGYAFLYDSNGQRVRDFTGYDFADIQAEGQVLIQNVHPTVAWASGVRGITTSQLRFTEETANGAPTLIGMPNCCP